MESDIVRLEVSYRVLQSYAFYVTLLIFKMVALSVFEIGEDLITRKLRRGRGFQGTAGSSRHRNGSGGEGAIGLRKLMGAHMDDLETILPFFTLGFVFTLTHPVPESAAGLFQIFTAARFIHSIATVVELIRQPIRAVAWAVSTVINLYMAFKILFYFL